MCYQLLASHLAQARDVFASRNCQLHSSIDKFWELSFSTRKPSHLFFEDHYLIYSEEI